MMALDDQGRVVWDWQLPEDFALSYSLKDVAVFTRWYLHDYPVAVWQSGDLLLVVGLDKETYMRFSELFPRSNVDGIPAYLRLAFTVNTVLILFFVLLLGYRFYKALKPIGKGIEKLSRQEPLHLREKGMAEIWRNSLTGLPLSCKNRRRYFPNRYTYRMDLRRIPRYPYAACPDPGIFGQAEKG